VRWTAVGVRRSYPFRSSKTSRRSFRLAVDRAALAARSTAPDDVARKLLEAFPGARSAATLRLRIAREGPLSRAGYAPRRARRIARVNLLDGREDPPERRLMT